MFGFGLPIFTVLFLIFLVWLSYELHKSNNRQQSTFWEQEAKANLVRKQPLDNLDYITIPIDSLPFFYGIDEKLENLQQTIQDLAGCTIVNLTGYTNTELKLTYGPGNLAALSEYDRNYTLLVRTLHSWGSQLSHLGYEAEAIRVLEFAVSIGSDVTSGYTLLADLYLNQNTPEKIDRLILAASSLNTLMKDSLLQNLEARRR